MEAGAEDVLARGRAASDANRFAEAYALLRPLAEAGHPEAQGIVGSLVQCGLHRFESLERLHAGIEPAVDEATARADSERAGRLLQAASDAGVGPASFNLAGMVVMGYGGGSWAERKARAAELYARAHAQGFTAFGWQMHGDGPGQPYLDLMEAYAAAEGIPTPGCAPESGAADRAGGGRVPG
jgi:TPR repeat protein